MAYWIFKCNPDKYHLEDRLADPEPAITWTVTRFREEINASDIVFLWVTGEQRGVRAVMKITEPPRSMTELEREQKYWAERDDDEQIRVIAIFTHRDVNLHHTELREVDGLENLSMFHGFQQGTNFRVTDAEGEVLMRLVEGGG
jgi:predicted RNA-binding protein with PUA-like domain